MRVHKKTKKRGKVTLKEYLQRKHEEEHPWQCENCWADLEQKLWYCIHVENDKEQTVDWHEDLCSNCYHLKYTPRKIYRWLKPRGRFIKLQIQY